MTSNSKVFYRSYFESHAEKSLHTMKTNTNTLLLSTAKTLQFSDTIRPEDERRKDWAKLGSEWFWNIYLWYYRYRYYVWNGAKVQDMPK